MDERNYTVGLPVTITVHADGSVTAEVDLSEASDLWDGVPTDQSGLVLYSNREVERDITTVNLAVRDGRVEVR